MCISDQHEEPSQALIDRLEIIFEKINRGQLDASNSDDASEVQSLVRRMIATMTILQFVHLRAARRARGVVNSHDTGNLDRAGPFVNVAAD